MSLPQIVLARKYIKFVAFVISNTLRATSFQTICMQVRSTWK